jgi:hypothetical protein
MLSCRITPRLSWPPGYYVKAHVPRQKNDAANAPAMIPGIGPVTPLRSPPQYPTRAPLPGRPRKVAAVAFANKMARIARALMACGERYFPAKIVTATPDSSNFLFFSERAMEAVEHRR